MRHFNQGRFRQQVRFLQHQFLQDGNLPFSDILSTELIEQALTALQVGLVCTTACSTPSPPTASPIAQIATSRGLGKDTKRNSPTCENPAPRSNAIWPKGLS
jgi:hypothetical protein